ncbi:DUF937 domain-containing protein [Sphingopyxis sp. MWB1]|uniref:DUF937 domain-containing protein n=1 Tax=Sphingopyxis sp. MWB1 TaxID=1537715 RepID=UPI00051A6B01|nr:DUF937 domain-containing protein [Sphingopyxis sp. MWB1]
MNLTDILQQAGGIESMAKELGLPPALAKQGADALLPAVLGGFKKQAQAGGAEGLGGMLSKLGGGNLLDAVVAPQPTPVEKGNDVLGEIFGSKDVSRSVAGHAAQQTGLDSNVLKKMLPMVAMMVAGQMSKQGGAQAPAGGAGGLGGLLGGGGGLGGMLGKMLGGAGGGAAAAGGIGGLAQMLDLNGDGNPLDDIMGMAGKLRG